MTNAAAPQFAAAGTFLEAMAAQDFDRLTTVLDPDATLSALLPGGFDEWHGSEAISAQFATWFGDTREYEVEDAAIGQVGSLLELRWRLRVRADRRADEVMVVEQHVYAETGPTGRIRTMRLLCSGFRPEHADA
jgi:SnoaL-like domain